MKSVNRFGWPAGLAICAVTPLLLTACLGSGSSSSTPTALTPAEITPPALPAADTNVVRFIAMGDSGSGSAGQIATGDAMREVCKQMGQQGAAVGQTDDFYIHRGCQFVLGFGDNIYEVGVNSNKDTLFFDKFEKAYLTMPADIPFYMALGNHDNTGFLGYASQENAAGVDTDTRRGDFQVAYTRQPVDKTGTDANNPKKTPRWQMPSRYYDFTAGGTASKPLVHFFAIDAITATSTLPDANSTYSYDGYGQEQLRWLKRGLASSPAQFKITFAHHPYLSNGSHGNAGAFEGLPNQLLPVASGQRYKDFLEEAMCDASDVFMNGHDHDLEWLAAVPACGRTEFLLSGAGGKSDRDLKSPENNTVRMQKGLTYGFFWVEVRINPATQKPQMKADMYTVAVDPAGKYAVQAKKIDGSNDGSPIRYSLTLQDPVKAVSATQARRRQDYLQFTEQSEVNVLQQKPRENPVFAGTPTKPTATDCKAATQTPIAASQANGPLNPVEQAYSRLTNSLAPSMPAQDAQVLAALSDAVVRVIDVNDTIAAAAMDAGQSRDPSYAQARLQEGYRMASVKLLRLIADMQASFPAGLPANSPWAAVPQSFQSASRKAAAADCSQSDLSAFVAPLVSLSTNLQAVAEAAQTQTGSVPVIGGVVKTLADAINNTTQLFAVSSTARLSLINDRVFATVDQVLRDVVTDVVPLEGNVPAQAPKGFTPTAATVFAVGSLKAASQEVAYNLERGLKPVTNPLVSALSGLAKMIGL